MLLLFFNLIDRELVDHLDAAGAGSVDPETFAHALRDRDMVRHRDGACADRHFDDGNLHLHANEQGFEVVGTDAELDAVATQLDLDARRRAGQDIGTVHVAAISDLGYDLVVADDPETAERCLADGSGDYRTGQRNQPTRNPDGTGRDGEQIVDEVHVHVVGEVDVVCVLDLPWGGLHDGDETRELRPEHCDEDGCFDQSRWEEAEGRRYRPYDEWCPDLFESVLRQAGWQPVGDWWRDGRGVPDQIDVIACIPERKP